VPGRLGSLLAVLVGSLAGAVAFLGSQKLFHAPELSWIRSGLRSREATVEVGVS
jgi:hypothetical protein